MKTAFDPLGVIKSLATNRVRFVLIGGMAMRVHGSNRVTTDTDICYDRSESNLVRLADSLRVLEARRIADLYPEGREVELSPEYLGAESMFAFMTRCGQVDCLAEPLGTRGFDDLDAHAVVQELKGMKLPVASTGSLRAMKKARGSLTDRMDLLFLDEIERAGGAPKP